MLKMPIQIIILLRYIEYGVHEDLILIYIYTPKAIFYLLKVDNTSRARCE